MKHPMQPIYVTDSGVARFCRNNIINWLFETGKIDLNDIALRGFSADDQMQLAMLLGYSVSGFSELSYADPNFVLQADAVVYSLLPKPPDDSPAVNKDAE